MKFIFQSLDRFAFRYCCLLFYYVFMQHVIVSGDTVSFPWNSLTVSVLSVFFWWIKFCGFSFQCFKTWTGWSNKNLWSIQSVSRLNLDLAIKPNLSGWMLPFTIIKQNANDSFWNKVVICIWIDFIYQICLFLIIKQIASGLILNKVVIWIWMDLFL